MQALTIAFFTLLAAATAVAEDADLLVYQVWEKGSEPYLSRILVTPDYVRLDEGDDAGGYTLFDRRLEVIYNVSPEDQTILVMDLTDPVPARSDTLVLSETVKPDPQAPLVAGRRPTQVSLLANGEVCTELVVIDGVMQAALDGLAELKQALARVHAATLAAMPQDIRTPCDLASNVFAADRSLRFGLPLREGGAGRSQSLVDFAENHSVDPALFTLPQGYGRRPLFGAGGF